MSIKPFISIIIPVYNGEKYINRLIDSITNQDYENYEIIIVNDGSTDKTKDILDNINNDKIKVYHQKNGGASSARNYGIKKSSGKYILFADSDDFYNENLFKKIVPYLEIGEYDLYYFNFNNYYNNNQYYTEYKYEEYEKIIGNNEPFYMYLNGEYTINLKRFPCNKIYKREIIIKNNVSFPSNQKLAEDMLFNIDYMCNCKNMKYISDALYNYCYNEDSITTKYFENMLSDILKQIENLKNLAIKYNVKNYEHYIGIFCLSNMTLIFSNKKKNKKTAYKKINKYFKNETIKKYIKCIEINKISFKQLVALLIVKVRLYYYIYLIMKK